MPFLRARRRRYNKRSNSWGRAGTLVMGPGRMSKPIIVRKSILVTNPVINSTTDVIGGTSFQLSGMFPGFGESGEPSFANAIAMYEQYKILNVTCEFCWDKVITSETASGTYDTPFWCQLPFYVYVDYTSALAEPTIAYFLERPNVKKVMAGSGEKLVVTFNPRPMQTIGEVSQVMDSVPWINTSEPEVPHYGLAIAYQAGQCEAGGTANVAMYNELQTITYTVAFRGLKNATAV